MESKVWDLNLMPEPAPRTVNCESSADSVRREDNIVLFSVVWGQGTHEIIDSLIPLGRPPCLNSALKTRPRSRGFIWWVRPATHRAGSKAGHHSDQLRYKWITCKVRRQDKWPHPAACIRVVWFASKPWIPRTKGQTSHHGNRASFY